MSITMVHSFSDAGVPLTDGREIQKLVEKGSNRMFDHISLFWWCRKINVEHICDDALSLGPCLQPYNDRIKMNSHR